MSAVKTKILIIEDEKAIHKLIKSAAEGDNYQILSAFSAEEGIATSAVNQPDLVILDLGLPGKEGFEVIKAIREWSQNLPILVLSARIDDLSKVQALDQGANDFVTKPFSMPELMARIRVLIRSNQRRFSESSTIEAGPFVIDIAGHIVRKAGEELHLTPTEFRLFLILAKNCNRVIPHRLLLKEVWGPGFANDVQYLRVFMKQLRMKIEADPAQPAFILTEPGVGYRLKSEVS